MKISYSIFLVILISVFSSISQASTTISGPSFRLNHISYLGQHSPLLKMVDSTKNIFSYTSEDQGRSDLVIELLDGVKKIKTRRIKGYINSDANQTKYTYDILARGSAIYIAYCTYPNGNYNSEPHLIFQTITKNLDLVGSPITILGGCYSAHIAFYNSSLYIQYQENMVANVSLSGVLLKVIKTDYIENLTAFSGGFIATNTETIENSPNDIGGYNINAMIYDKNFILKTKKRVNNYFSSVWCPEDICSSLAVLKNGNVAIAWTDGSQVGEDSDYWAVHAKVLDKNLKSVGKELIANKITEQTQDIPEILSLSKGGFLITWHSFEYPHVNKVREFSQTGKPVTGDITVINELDNETVGHIAQMASGKILFYADLFEYNFEDIIGRIIVVK